MSFQFQPVEEPSVRLLSCETPTVQISLVSGISDESHAEVTVQLREPEGRSDRVGRSTTQEDLDYLRHALANDAHFELWKAHYLQISLATNADVDVGFFIPREARCDQWQVWTDGGSTPDHHCSLRAYRPNDEERRWVRSIVLEAERSNSGGTSTQPFSLPIVRSEVNSTSEVLIIPKISLLLPTRSFTFGEHHPLMIAMATDFNLDGETNAPRVAQVDWYMPNPSGGNTTGIASTGRRAQDLPSVDEDEEAINDGHEQSPTTVGRRSRCLIRRLLGDRPNTA